MANKRLKREPDYNVKRRQGTGTIHLEVCESCGFRIPQELDVAQALSIPCSPYHVRCVRCQWPVAKTLISEDGLCVTCMHERERRNYHRLRGTYVYAEVDKDTVEKENKDVSQRRYDNGTSTTEDRSNKECSGT